MIGCPGAANTCPSSLARARSAITVAVIVVVADAVLSEGSASIPVAVTEPETVSAPAAPAVRTTVTALLASAASVPRAQVTSGATWLQPGRLADTKLALAGTVTTRLTPVATRGPRFAIVKV